MRNVAQSRSRVACCLASVSGALLAGVGCASHQTSPADGLSATTASVQAIRAANVPLSPPRAHTPTRFSVSPKSGSVAHSPAYFRSDTERPDFDDTDFGISGTDIAVWIPEAVRFFISIALHPLDLLFTPPWTHMQSDGQQVGRAAPGHRSEHGSG